MKTKRGFTILELILVILIVGILAIAAIPFFQNMRDKALRAAEDGVVGAVRGGLNTYRAESQVLNRTPAYPLTLDTANAGDASVTNPFFMTVLASPIVTQWSKQGLAYTGPAGNVYNYYPDQGVFVPSAMAPGYVTAWTMNEGSGSTINMGPYQGSLVGNVQWAQGKVDEALQFDGNGSYVRIADSPALNPTTAGTVQAWVYADALKPFAGFVHKGDKADFSDESYTLQTWSSDSLIFGINDTAGNFRYAQSSAPLQTGQWYHMVGTWDSNGIKLYVNGQLSGSYNQGVVARVSSGGLNIGSQTVQNYNSSWLNLPHQGRIDEVAVYDRALTAAEITSYYNTTNH